MIQKTLATAIFLFLACQLCAQRSFEDIAIFLEEQRQAWHIPNISIAITSRDSVLYVGEFGSDNSRGNYLIGSISKPFTAIAVMQLVEDGKMSLDDPVRKHLSWFETHDESVSNRITVRHLLNQTSGLPKKAGFFTPQSQDPAEIERAYKSYLLSLRADEAAIGKEHIYCNLNYQLLGQIIQRVSGLAYAAYVDEHIFGPCDMKNTFATDREAKGHGLKNGYQYIFGYPVIRAFSVNDNGVAAGDIASNATDMSKFLQVLLNHGQTAQGSLVAPSTLGQMHVPFSNRYGMGFSIGDWNGLHSIRHSGLTKNYSGAINILPDQNYGIVILTNVNSFSAVRNLMDGVIIRLNDQEKVAYIPYDIYIRYAILGLLLWGLADLLFHLHKWRKQGYGLGFSKKRKDMLRLLVSILVALSWLFTVPYFAQLPLSALPLLQPDLGYALIIGAVAGVLSALVKYVVRSNTMEGAPSLS